VWGGARPGRTVPPDGRGQRGRESGAGGTGGRRRKDRHESKTDCWRAPSPAAEMITAGATIWDILDETLSASPAASRSARMLWIRLSAPGKGKGGGQGRGGVGSAALCPDRSRAALATARSGSSTRPLPSWIKSPPGGFAGSRPEPKPPGVCRASTPGKLPCRPFPPRSLERELRAPHTGVTGRARGRSTTRAGLSVQASTPTTLGAPGCPRGHRPILSLSPAARDAVATFRAPPGESGSLDRY